MPNLKLALFLIGQTILILLLAFLLIRNAVMKKPDQVIMERIKTNYVILERLTVLSNQEKKITAEDANEKRIIDRLSSLTNGDGTDELKLFYTLQSNK